MPRGLFESDGAGGEIEIEGEGAVDVEADAKNRHAVADLDENAADLALVHQHIVGPLDAGARTGSSLDSFSDGKGGGHDQEVRREGGTKHEREGEHLAGQRLP